MARLMTRLLAGVVLSLALSCPAWATFSLVQHPSNASCSISTSTCAITLTQSIGASHLGIIVALYNNASARTVSGDKGGSYTTCTGGTSTGNCPAADGNSRVAISYVTSTSSGATPLTCTLTAVSNTAWACEFIEFSPTGAVALNTGTTPTGNRDQSTTSTSPAGATLSLSANNGVIVQGIFSLGTASAISAGWTADFPGGDGVGWKLNTTDGTAPTWTQTNVKAALSGIAFEETGGAATCVHTLTLLGAGCS